MATLRDGVIRRGSTWAYVVRVPDPETGRSRPRWVGGFSTEAEAKAARDEARVRARRGEYVDRSRITVAEYLESWLDSHAVEVKPRTLSGYRYLIRQYVLPNIGSQRLQSIRPSLLSTLYRDLLAAGGRNGKPLSVRTVDYVHAILRKALNDAVHVEHLLSSNPAERAKRPKHLPREPGSIWSTSDLGDFLDVAAEHRLFAFYRLAAYTGARRGELLYLRWNSVDLTTPHVRIRGSAGVIDRQWSEGTTKGGRERVLGIDAETASILREHRARQTEERLIVGEAWEGDDYVFATGFGRPIYPDTVSQLMPRLIAKANQRRAEEGRSEPLAAARLHDLRHIHATTLLLEGVPVHVVADRLGHADPSITLRVYAHVMRHQAAGVADVFARAVKEGRNRPDEEAS